MTNITEAGRETAASIKDNLQRVVYWAKKNPALAVLLIGAVVILALATKKAGARSGVLASGEGSGGDDVLDALGGGGGGFLDFPTPPQIGDLFQTETPASPTQYIISETPSSSIPTGTIFPEDEDEKEYYKSRSEELEAIAGQLDDPLARSLAASGARWYGIASLPDDVQRIYAYGSASRPTAPTRSASSPERIAQASTARWEALTAYSNQPSGRTTTTNKASRSRSRRESNPPPPSTRTTRTSGRSPSTRAAEYSHLAERMALRRSAMKRTRTAPDRTRTPGR